MDHPDVDCLVIDDLNRKLVSDVLGIYLGVVLGELLCIKYSFKYKDDSGEKITRFRIPFFSIIYDLGINKVRRLFLYTQICYVTEKNMA